MEVEKKKAEVEKKEASAPICCSMEQVSSSPFFLAGTFENKPYVLQAADNKTSFPGMLHGEFVAGGKKKSENNIVVQWITADYFSATGRNQYGEFILQAHVTREGFPREDITKQETVPGSSKYVCSQCYRPYECACVVRVWSIHKTYFVNAVKTKKTTKSENKSTFWRRYDDEQLAKSLNRNHGRPRVKRGQFTLGFEKDSGWSDVTSVINTSVINTSVINTSVINTRDVYD